MTIKEILDYQVIPQSEKRKDGFNQALEEKMFKIIDTFENEYGELFVVYTYKVFDKVLFITGDEFSWEIGWEMEISGNAVRRFMLNEEEIIKSRKILRNWLNK